MCISHQTTPRTKTLTTFSTTSMYEPMTAWIPCTGLDSVRLAYGLRKPSDFKVRPAIQYAEVRTEDPSAWTALTAVSFQSADGDYMHTETLSDNDTNYWVRFGVEYQGSSADGRAGVHFQAFYEHLGKTVGSAREMQVWQRREDTDSRYYPITRWVGTGGLVKAKAALTFSSVLGSPKMTVAVRSAATDPKDADDWVNIEGLQKEEGNSATRLISDKILDSLTGFTLTDKMYVQFALVLQSEGVANEDDAQASVKAAVAVRS